jgi:hypothetical protein
MDSPLANAGIVCGLRRAGGFIGKVSIGIFHGQDLRWRCRTFDHVVDGVESFVFDSLFFWKELQ